MLDALVNDPSYVKMHLTFNILLISSVVFGFLELILAMLSFTMMGRVEKIRIVHRINGDGVEVDEEGNPIKKRATLARLVRMAGPVSGFLKKHFNLVTILFRFIIILK